ncbi:MAG: hypothetical protein MZV64_73915 [Ignavibacteriales bacterium]|nr:hypothetical protein [Ignavibacteriales bacterium]
MQKIKKIYFELTNNSRRDGTANEKGTGIGLDHFAKNLSRKTMGFYGLRVRKVRAADFLFTVPRYLGNLQLIDK